jgi:protein-tyrosine phosphatase
MLERQIPIPGAVNLRDFGGYTTADGHSVRRGALYRSGTLTHLDRDAQQALLDLGVALICDLRRDAEKADEPTPFAPGAPARLEIPIDPGSAVEMRERLSGEADLNLADRIEFMVEINRELARDHADDYARMFAGLLDLPEGGFLVHCSAGKDRTGFACALILHCLGVPRATVVEDYLMTNEALDFEGYILPRVTARLHPRPVPDRATIMALAGVRPEYLQGAYEAIEAQFEGVEHYIEEAVGINPATRARLRNQFLG